MLLSADESDGRGQTADFITDTKILNTTWRFILVQTMININLEWRAFWIVRNMGYVECIYMYIFNTRLKRLFLNDLTDV